MAHSAAWKSVPTQRRWLLLAALVGSIVAGVAVAISAWGGSGSRSSLGDSVATTARAPVTFSKTDLRATGPDLSALPEAPAGLATSWQLPNEAAVPADAVVVLDTARVDSPTDFSGLRLFKPDGTEFAAAATNPVPIAIIRTSHEEILVSDEPDGPFDEFAGARGRLAAYDLADRLRLKWQVDLPGRAAYLLYRSQLMALTGDESYLVYSIQRWDSSASCRESKDGNACGVFGLGVVRLDARQTSEVALPRSCGGSRL